MVNKVVQCFLAIYQNQKKSVLSLLKFLINLKTHEIFSKFLRFKLYKKCLQSAAFYKSWQTKVLAREIQFKRKAEDGDQEEGDEIRLAMHPSSPDLSYKQHEQQVKNRNFSQKLESL